MSRTLILIAGVFAFLSGAQGASAFSTRQVDPVTANDRLADPAELADKRCRTASLEEPALGFPVAE
jgi:hypothetical protein